MIKIVFFFLLTLSSALANSAEDFFAQAISEFPVIIYVNKSVKSRYGQRIVVFNEGRQIMHDRVSTGREQFEAERFSSTPVGFFTPTFLSEEHVASKSGIPMPYSIFFHKNIALHQAVSSNHGLAQLGRRASSGCVRLSDRLAPKLFDLVSRVGKGRMPIIHEGGEVAVTAAGEIYHRESYMTLIVVDESTAENPPLLSKIQSALR